MDLQEINKRFKYKSDPERFFDMWFIMPETPIMEGDCEDYALSVFYYDVCNKSLWLFWLRLIFNSHFKIHFVYTKNNVGHVVLRCYDRYIDNWTKKWVWKEDIETLGHKFYKNHLRWYHVAYRMLHGKLVRQVINDN